MELFLPVLIRTEKDDNKTSVAETLSSPVQPTKGHN